MVALLVGLSVAAVLMSALLPAWGQMARREKEAELVFRGQQYARAIGLFQRKAGPGVLPPSVEVLVQQRHLRRAYKDPITGNDFELLSVLRQEPQAQGRGGTAAASRGTPQSGAGAVVGAAGRGNAPGGIMGVASTSTDESLMTFNGRTHYNEWQFLYVAQTQAPGTGGTGAAPQRGPSSGGARGGSNDVVGGFGGPGAGGAGGRGRGDTRGGDPRSDGSGGRGNPTPTGSSPIRPLTAPGR